MGRRQAKIFIGAPIGGSAPEGFMELMRRTIEGFENEGVTVYCEHKLILEERGGGRPGEIMSRNLRWLNDCHLALFILPMAFGGPMRSDGMFIELGWAVRARKPVAFAADFGSAGRQTSVLWGLSELSSDFTILDFDEAFDPGDLVRRTMGLL